MVIFRVSADGFLYNMVRIIAGTLLRVGGGYYPPEYVKEILEAKKKIVEEIKSNYSSMIDKINPLFENIE